MRITDSSVRRAAKVARDFARWRRRHPETWEVVEARAASARSPVGINSLLEGLSIPANLAPAAAMELRAEFPDASILCRETAHNHMN